MSFLNKQSNQSYALKVGARASPLSQIQVQEILSALKQHHPLIDFTISYISTTGDKDQNTSLRTLEKTDFFTKEIDELVLTGHCQIGVHSAKDLPDPIPKGLTLVCLTQSIDSSDSLVLRKGLTLETLPKNAIIATSSLRREKTVKELRSDVHFIDMRGTINQRLAKLESGEAQGVVIAEAALIRLGLTHLNRIRLPGNGIEGQGQLAILAQENDQEMIELFSCIDGRMKKLP